MRPDQRFHTYELEYDSLAAGASQAQSFTVETLYDFWIFKQQAFVLDVAMEVQAIDGTMPMIDVLMQDGSSQAQLSNKPLALAAVFGTGQIPYILPQPHLIPAGAQFTVTVTNRHSANDYTIRLQFSGVHVPPGGVPGRAVPAARSAVAVARRAVAPRALR